MRKKAGWAAVASQLLPRGFRRRFGADLADTIRDLSADARASGGHRRQWFYVARELLALARLSIALRRRPVSNGSRRTPRERAMTAGIGRDIRWAVRHAWRRPVFAIVVLVTIAMSIATATTAVGLASSVLWKPLPFDDAEGLAFVWEEVEREGQQHPFRVTGARHAAWRNASGDIASLALFGAAGFTIETPAGASSVRGVRVSSNYFDVLGIRPLLGRTFVPGDEIPGQEQVVVLSTSFWQEHFGGRQEAVGASLRLGGLPYTVVGVMPPVTFPAWPANPAVVTLDPESRRFWIPIPRTPQLDQNGRSHVFGVLARLRPGVSRALLVDRLNRTRDEGGQDRHGARVEPLRRQFVSDARTPLLIVAGAALAVLLTACANLAALYASAFAARRGELSTRLAVGAMPSALIRQLAFETLLLVGSGTILGIGIAAVVLPALPRLLPTSVPFLTVPAVDIDAVIFAVGLAAFAIAIVIASPVVRLLVSPPSPRGAAPRERGIVFRALAVAQVAIALALTSSAALLGRSLVSVERQDPGFSIERVLVADVGLPSRLPTEADRTAALEQQLLDAVRSRPGVLSVAAAYDHPLEANWIENPTIRGEAAAQDAQLQVDLRIVSPGYFEALDVELLEGRPLSDRDVIDSAGAAVVNEAFAQQLGGRVIGRRIVSGTPSAIFAGAPTEFEIVGVVANERFRGLEHPAQAAYYLSTRQFPQRGVTLLARTSAAPLDAVADIRAAVRSVDPSITFDRATTLERVLHEQLISRKMTTDVLGGFAAAALGLAALGIYGLVAILVARRTRDLGIRLAVGASRATLAREVVGYALANTVVGVTLGCGLALAAGRVIRGLLVGVSPYDATTLAAVAAVLVATAVLSSLPPAIRAARIDPIAALRD